MTDQHLQILREAVATKEVVFCPADNPDYLWRVNSIDNHGLIFIRWKEKDLIDPNFMIDSRKVELTQFAMMKRLGGDSKRLELVIKGEDPAIPKQSKFIRDAAFSIEADITNEQMLRWLELLGMTITKVGIHELI